MSFSATIGYLDDALNPVLSSETIRYHYGKHHVGYANTLNKLIDGTEFQSLSLEEIIVRTRNRERKIFNNASQLFNHDFYWKCLKNGCPPPSKKLLDLINDQFGNFDTFRDEYIAFAGDMFGSGWSWLVVDDDKLKFFNTSNAENPIGSNVIPVCVIDLWEHAYYIDYRNNRGEYVKKIITECINWDFCESKLAV